MADLPQCGRKQMQAKVGLLELTVLEVVGVGYRIDCYIAVHGRKRDNDFLGTADGVFLPHLLGECARLLCGGQHPF